MTAEPVTQTAKLRFARMGWIISQWAVCFLGLKMWNPLLRSIVRSLPNMAYLSRCILIHFAVKKGDFRRILEDPGKAPQFYNDLAEMLCSLPAQVTGCVVHRPGYNERYAGVYGDARWDLCKSAYTIVVERAAKFAGRYDRKLMVYVEQTGEKEDRAIVKYHSDLRNQGMYFSTENSAKYNPLEAVDFRKRLFAEPKFVRKAHVLAQLSDLVLYPLAKGRYQPDYPPYRRLWESGRIIDAVLSGEETRSLGIKYYCFDGL